MLDGAEVNIGDSVYVVGMGQGQVTGVSSDGSFTVKIQRNSYTFMDGGFIGKVRKVYWHNPIFVVPPKDVDLWTVFQEQALYNYGLLVRLFASGKRTKVAADEEKDS